MKLIREGSRHIAFDVVLSQEAKCIFCRSLECDIFGGL